MKNKPTRRSAGLRTLDLDQLRATSGGVDYGTLADGVMVGRTIISGALVVMGAAFVTGAIVYIKNKGRS
jgi:hypothetical protein